MAADLIHHGHINIINEARKYGRVVIGLLTDEAVASYKRVPLLSWDQRRAIVQSIKGVDEVIAQEELDYVPNLRRLRPDYVVHGTDWREGIQKPTRQRVLETLKEWGGQLVEVKPVVRVIEVHNGLTALIAERVQVVRDGSVREFDAMWSSSLPDPLAKGKPDIEAVDPTSRIVTVDQIFEVTTKPMIYDGDSGGPAERFVFLVKTLERLGCSAVIIEDKVGPKRNSLFGTEVRQEQDTLEAFSAKIGAGKQAQVTDDFMVIARIESLIAGAGQEDALRRAEAYIAAGADAIMIHSAQRDPTEIFAFMDAYRDIRRRVPLVVVPSTYNSVTEDDLADRGANVVIYANHLIRSAYPAMWRTAESILEHGRSLEADEYMLPIAEALRLVPGSPGASPQRGRPSTLRSSTVSSR